MDLKPTGCKRCPICDLIKQAFDNPKDSLQQGENTIFLRTDYQDEEYDIMIAKYDKGETVEIYGGYYTAQIDVSDYYVVIIRCFWRKGSRRTYYCPKGHHIKSHTSTIRCSKCPRETEESSTEENKTG